MHVGPPRKQFVQVHLKRPCEEFPAYRLDRLLARKAAAGVQIYVLLYKEVINTMPLYSFYSKTALRKYVDRRTRSWPNDRRRGLINRCTDRWLRTRVHRARVAWSL